MPWFLCLAVLLLAVPVAWFNRERHTVLCVLFGACVLAGVGLWALWPGRFYVEKSLTRLAMPTGLVWLGLLVACGAALGRRAWGIAALLVGVTAAFTAAGNPVVADRLVRYVEGEYVALDPLDAGTFDAVAVLGGGVSLNRHDRPMANEHGDRAVLAARLYHAGRTPVLVAAGTAPETSACPGPGEITRTLFGEMGIPERDVILAEGENTSREIASLKTLCEEHGWRRLGLITSGFHLPRAMRLAADAGLTGKAGAETVPLPADLGGRLSETAPQWIPESAALATTDRCCKELLAGLVAR